MSEWVDLRKFLANWPYDPDNDARVIHGEGGREILQVRTPLGLEQYELEGRPDGSRPHGMESALDYHLERLDSARKEQREGEFELNETECAELFNEGTLYYLRYLRLFQLRDWARTARDTTRNLRVFDLVHRYAQREEDQQYLEKWRPYILRMQAISEAMIALEEDAHHRAEQILLNAIEAIELLPELNDETFGFERERSLAALRDLVKQVEKKKPVTELESLEQQLRRAIEEQEFELAAQLRDRIRALRNAAR